MRPLRERSCTFAGPALSLLPLILFRTRTPMSLAVCCLAAFMGLQAFCYAGFHAYVQVMPELSHTLSSCCCHRRLCFVTLYFPAWSLSCTCWVAWILK